MVGGGWLAKAPTAGLHLPPVVLPACSCPFTPASRHANREGVAHDCPPLPCPTISSGTPPPIFVREAAVVVVKGGGVDKTLICLRCHTCYKSTSTISRIESAEMGANVLQRLAITLVCLDPGIAQPRQGWGWEGGGWATWPMTVPTHLHQKSVLLGTKFISG